MLGYSLFIAALFAIATLLQLDLLLKTELWQQINTLVTYYMVHPVMYIIVYIFVFLLFYVLFQFMGLWQDRYYLSQLQKDKNHQLTISIILQIFLTTIAFISGRSTKNNLLIEYHQQLITNTPTHKENLLTQFTKKTESIFSNRLSILEFGIWLLPLLGFIGTVIGITQAIDHIGALFIASEQQQQLIQQVMQGLATAFHTTLFGLLSVIPVMLFWYILRAKLEHLLQEQLFFLSSLGHSLEEKTA